MRIGADFDADGAGLGELDRVADEIDEDLAKTDRVGLDELRDGRGEGCGKLQALAAALTCMSESTSWTT